MQLDLNRTTEVLDQAIDISSFDKINKTKKTKIDPNLKCKPLKVLYVFTNIDGMHYDNYHFGLATLVSVTKNLGHDVQLSLLSNREHYSDYSKIIKEFKPDVVGFSAVSSQFPFCKELAQIAKDNLPNVITIAGGVHPTLSPDSLLDGDSIDGFIRGEAEEAIVDFLINVSNGLDYKKTDNYAYVENGKVVSNELKPLVKDLDELPLPDKEIYPYYENTIKLIGSAPFFFTRGCPYTCTYCMNQSFADLYGRKRNFPRYRSPESCIQEIEDVVVRHHKDIEYIFIGDDIFGPNLKWRKEFCDKYKERILQKFGTKFMVLLRVEMCQNDETLKALKDAGAFRIFFGVESGDEAQRREVLDRKMTDKTITTAFDNCHKNGLETLAVNIIGFPGETEEMIKSTVKLNRELKMSSSGVNIFYPYHGTPLGDHCFENDLVDIDKFNNFSMERRESTLKFSKEHEDMIMRYFNNWDNLVYPIYTFPGVKLRVRLFRDAILKQLGVFDFARDMYRNNKKWFRPGNAS